MQRLKFQRFEAIHDIDGIDGIVSIDGVDGVDGFGWYFSDGFIGLLHIFADQHCWLYFFSIVFIFDCDLFVYFHILHFVVEVTVFIDSYCRPCFGVNV